MPVLHHTFYIQIFNRNKGWLGFHNLCNCFLNIIGADMAQMSLEELYRGEGAGEKYDILGEVMKDFFENGRP